MNRAHWKDWLEGVGIVAIVASLVFVGLQMRQAQDIALSQGMVDNLANQFTLSNTINANADIWVRGNAGDELDESEAAIYRNLLRDMNAYAVFTVMRLRRMGQHATAENTIADFAGYLHDNPGALQIWNSRQELLDRNRGLLTPDVHATSTWQREIRSKLDTLRKKLE